ncbi:MAG: hypothetical protein AB8B56_09520 [Crocinitomicaceae bacterium]
MATDKPNKQQQKVNLIIADLQSDDPKKVKKAIKSLETHGNATVIKPLFQSLREGVLPEKHQAKILELLCSLKDTSVIPEVMDVLDDEELVDVRPLVLTAIWNMKVDFSGYIDDFVLIATQGTFMEALDCLTIIENMDGPFMEENILESQLHLKAYLEKDEKPDAQKSEILSEIALHIKKINMNLMD